MNFVLIDTSHLLYRSWHTFNKLATKDGHPTGMHFGVMRAIEHLKKTIPDSAIVFVYDGKPRQRKDIYPEYKAGRGTTESHGDIVHEFGMKMDITELVTATGCGVVNHSEFEADDLIGMLAKSPRAYLPMSGVDDQLTIYSGDDDFNQLVRPTVRLLKPPAGKTHLERFLDEAAVEADWGVAPTSMALYRSFLGDSGDNIKGLPRIPRSPLQQAVKGKTEPYDFYNGDSLAYFSPDWKKKVKEFQPMCELNYRLTRLPWSFERQLPIEYHDYGVDLVKLRQLFEKLEFSSFIKKLGALEELLVPTSYAKAVSSLTQRFKSRADQSQGVAQSTT